MTPDLWIAMAVCLWAPAMACLFGVTSGTFLRDGDDRLAIRDGRARTKSLIEQYQRDIIETLRASAPDSPAP